MTSLFEAQLREQIALQIEGLCNDDCDLYPGIYYHNGHVAAASIARGELK